MRDLDFTIDKAWDYINGWRQAYKTIPFIRDDYDFDRKFDLMLAERCVGAILVDVENQNYERNRAEHLSHLKAVFRGIFEKLSNKL